MCVEYESKKRTQHTGLAANWYDLVFCDFFLQSIWNDRSRKNPEEDVYRAVAEMARLIISGGYVAAYERIKAPGRPMLDYGVLFGRAGLREAHYQEMEIRTDQGMELHAAYLYRKL